MTGSELGRNVLVKHDKTKKQLVITIDLEDERWLSGSGKSNMIASTQGNKQFQANGESVSIGINIYTKN